MKTIKLCNLFYIHQGVQINKNLLSEAPNGDSIKYLRPTNNIKRLVSAYISDAICKEYEVKIFNGEYIIVGTNGQGSHSYAYVVDDTFTPNGNLAVLEPKIPMSTEVKNLYAYYITMNRKLFSYGRIPQGERLKNIKIPTVESIPLWINDSNNDEIDSARKTLTKIDAKIKQWTNQKSPSIKTVELGTLFTIEKSEKLSLEKQIKEKNGVRYVAKSGQNNGVVAHVQENASQKKFLPMKLTVALVGSVLSTYLQDVPFYCADRLAILTPKIKMTEMQLLLYAYYLNSNKKFYSYGRPADSTLANIKVPDIKSLPHWLNLFD